MGVPLKLDSPNSPYYCVFCGTIQITYFGMSVYATQFRVIDQRFGIKSYQNVNQYGFCLSADGLEKSI